MIESELPVITNVVELCAHVQVGVSVQPLGIAHFPRAAVNSQCCAASVSALVQVLLAVVSGRLAGCVVFVDKQAQPVCPRSLKDSWDVTINDALFRRGSVGINLCFLIALHLML